MCKLTTSIPCSSSDSPYVLLTIEESEDSMHKAPLLSKAQASQEKENSSYRNLKTQKTQLTLAFIEAISIAKIALPMILTGLLLYSRSMISMLFLGRLGELELAGGSLAVGFADITGYSILSGLAMGMEPICGQAFGAKKHTLLGLTLQRTVLLLMLISIPISLLWLNMKKILLFCGQDEIIAREAQSYLFYSLPDLLAQSLLHPLRIYLRSQSITLPLTFCATLSIILHIPINRLLVSHLDLGIKGVALSGAWTNLNLVGSLIIYILISGTHKKTWGGISLECLKEWKPLLNMAIPSCISVCLEWWWYEIMILLCGLLINPRATVASMGILIQTTALTYIFPSSLSFSVSTRVGNELGANQPKKAKLAATVGLSFSFILGFSSLLFAIMVRNSWASMFTQDKEIIGLTSLVLPIIGLCELGNCPQTTGRGVLRGTARPKVGANINLGCFYLVGMPVAIWLGFYTGLDFRGLWLGLLAAQGSCAVTMLVVLGLTDWGLEAKRAEQLTGALLVDDDSQKIFKAEIKEHTLILSGDLDQPGRMRPQPHISKEVQTDKSTTDIPGRTEITNPGTGRAAPDSLIAVPMEVNGGGGELEGDGRRNEFEARDSMKHIPDFEEILKDLNGKVLDKVEFRVGCAETGLKGVSNKNRPNKSGSKGKQKLRPISGPELKQNEEVNKGVMGLRKGAWKRGVTQSPCTNAGSPLNVEIGSKRKFEGLNKDVAEVITQEKKKRVADDNDCAEAGKVAGQSRRDQ